MADLVITASQVLAGANAQTNSANAGATITAGQTVYKNSSNEYVLADANVSAATAAVVGIALNGAATGQPVKVQTGGTITVGAAAAPAVGVVYILSETPGGIKPIADVDVGDRVSILGIGNTGNVIDMRIWNTGVVVAA